MPGPVTGETQGRQRDLPLQRTAGTSAADRRYGNDAQLAHAGINPS
ncbi:hypothetical protein BN1232_00381 [Mycobacterium lentiflavum]|uniref:Uncharacterized protein n=1 Tax=Mycobacterium lentiflavum TaxID=141349 RepID=A0A0E3WB18_MYCLN|nr:hypothetical protein BN1232_00381 [Mycobacterium lentiflavum]